MRRKLYLRIIIAFLFLLICTPSKAYTKQRIFPVPALDSVSISASGSSTSDAINLNDYMPSGYFAGQITISTGGTYKFEVLASGDGTTYKTVQGQSEIITGVTTTSGPDSDGKLFVPFSIGAPTQYLKIKATETGGSSGGTVSFLLLIATDQ